MNAPTHQGPAASERQYRIALAPLGVLAFWCGLWIAARRYPSLYDWRYMTISNLVYPDRNPEGYRWAWGGLIACALGGLAWTAALIRDWPRTISDSRPFGLWALALGYLCMVCALVPGRLLPVQKGHEVFALSAFIGLCIGIVQLTLEVAERCARLQMRGPPGGPRVVGLLCAGVAVAPITLAGLATWYVSRELPQLPWVGIEWRTRGVPVYLSFAFWEWISCALFSVYTVSLCILTRPGGLRAAACEDAGDVLR